MFLLPTVFLRAQNSTIVSANAQLRSLFQNLAKPNTTTNHLYDMAVHISDSVYFAPQCVDTLWNDMWFKIYDEMRYSAYDTSTFPNAEQMAFQALSYQGDTIPIGILDLNFFKLKKNALTTNIFFNFDTVNTLLTDKPFRPSWPYLDSVIFAVSALKKESYFSNPVFLIDPQFIFTDFDGKKQYLFIDFGDGLGYQSVSTTSISYFNVDYSNVSQIVIKAKVLNSDNIEIKNNISYFARLIGMPALIPDEILESEGLSANVYYGCNGKDATRTIIYLEGFDVLDFIPAFNRTADQIYSQMIKGDALADLQNFDYNYIVVDWKNSRIDLRYNARYLVALLERLKAEAENDEPFVIIGESMGGLIARFALNYMESKDYAKCNYSPFFVENLDLNNILYYNLNSQNLENPEYKCIQTERMHNTRLLITLDTPHKGANIPIGFQLAYRSVFEKMDLIYGHIARLGFKAFNLFLDGQAAQQMLLLHIDSENPFEECKSYQPHNDYRTFQNQLNKQLGGYPLYAKTVLLSNGSLPGERQINYFTQNFRTPGDKLIDFDFEIFGRLLGLKIPLFGGALKINTNNTICSDALKANLGRYTIQIKLKGFGIRVTTGYNSILNIQKKVKALPYCVSAGGYIGSPLLFFQSNVGNTSGVSFLKGLFSYNYNVSSNGCVTSDAQLGLGGLASYNFDMRFCSDGLHFGFIPTQSALDYADFPQNNSLAQYPLNHNIQAEPISGKLSRLKADVSIGIPSNLYNDFDININSFPITNMSHLHIRNQGIKNLMDQNSSPEFRYYSCRELVDENQDRVTRGILNLEIGDEELYLENFKVKANSTFRTEYDLVVNGKNKYYEYISQNTLDPTYIGMYSKDAPFEIENLAQVNLIADISGTPTNIGVQYNAPFTGSYSIVDQILNNCCNSFKLNRMAQPEQTNIEALAALLFPNPNAGQGFSLKGENIAHVSLYDLQGRLLYQRGTADQAIEQYVALPMQLNQGIYVVKVNFTNASYQTFKYIVQP